MSARATAARYARALLDVAVAEKLDVERVERDLSTFAALLAGNRELHSALTNPAVPATGKRGVVEALVGRLGFEGPLSKLLLLLAERDRLTLVPDLVALYRERLLEHQQVVRAEVTTAVPLPVDRAAQLQQTLAEVTGRRVTMTTRVDTAIIGGVVARVGSTVYDGSVATQLAAMRQRLLEQG